MIKQSSIDKLIGQLSDWLEEKESSLDREESKDYPSEDRLEKLENQIDTLQAALDALVEYEI